jgi:leucyl-tRNA synthetase
VSPQIFNLPVKQVVAPSSGDASLPLEEAFTGEGVAVNSGSLIDGLPTSEAKTKVLQALADKGRGGAQTTYKLRDWVFSRYGRQGGGCLAGCSSSHAGVSSLCCDLFFSWV